MTEQCVADWRSSAELNRRLAEKNGADHPDLARHLIIEALIFERCANELESQLSDEKLAGASAGAVAPFDLDHAVNGENAVRPTRYPMWQTSGLTLMGLFKDAVKDDGLTDAEFRNLVRYLSAEPISPADVRRSRELAQRFGWAVTEEGPLDLAPTIKRLMELSQHVGTVRSLIARKRVARTDSDDAQEETLKEWEVILNAEIERLRRADGR